MQDDLPEIELRQPLLAGDDRVLSPDALDFLATLVDEFSPERLELLAARQRRQENFDEGIEPDFDPDTRPIRDSDWTVAAIPEEVLDRRTEITGPVNRKLVINALNSGAQVYMADFEDSTAPGWRNLVDGQCNLYDAVRRQIDFETNDKAYRLKQDTAVLMVRPRGLHLPEHHARLGGEPIPGALFDFALYLFNNHAALAGQGSRPYFYLPKLEHWTEARWWNRVIDRAEQLLGLSPGTVRVTVLIETLPAVFQMHEILHALKSRILGLNCGRWDYIFSYIKTFRRQADKVLPDRAQVTMQVPFLAEYSRALIQTCHRRGAFAMGGMAAQIPIRGDEDRNQRALEKVRKDKALEADNGHDGTWVAHPALEPIARTEFDQRLEGPNQIDTPLDKQSADAEQLRMPAEGSITEAGVRENIRVGVQYTAAWIAGVGCLPINHLMEDAATAEISRAQLWQWLQHEVELGDGRPLDRSLIAELFKQEVFDLNASGDQPETLSEAAELFQSLILAEELAEFLTLPAYLRLIRK